MKEIEDGVFIDMTNIEQKSENIDGFGITSDPQTKKKAPGRSESKGLCVLGQVLI